MALRVRRSRARGKPVQAILHAVRRQEPGNGNNVSRRLAAARLPLTSSETTDSGVVTATYRPG